MRSHKNLRALTTSFLTRAGDTGAKARPIISPLVYIMWLWAMRSHVFYLKYCELRNTHDSKLNTHN